MRSHFSGSTLVNLLESWLPAGVKASRQDIAERLGAGLSVADAVALHAVLQAAGEPVVAGHGAAPADVRRACDAVQADVSARIASVAWPVADAPAAPGFAFVYQLYLGVQHPMAARVDALRADVRQALQHASPKLAQLANLDSVLAQTWGHREHRCWAAVPVLLAHRFDARCPPNAPTDADAAQASTGTDSVCWDALLGDVRALLQAELTLRMQPVWGLVEAFHGDNK